MNVKVVVAYHPGCDKTIGFMPKKYPNVFYPVLGGSYKYSEGSDNFFDNIPKDNLGDNISELNFRFSEHTQLYWLYKHLYYLGNPDMVGLCHYRRYMDLDYDNLDPSVIYLRRDPTIRIESSKDTILCWNGQEISEYILDLFLNDMPMYKDAMELTLSDYRFYDKSMFVVNRSVFLEYMEFVTKCYRLFMTPGVDKQIEQWYYDGHPKAETYLFKRGISYFLEMIHAIYFTQQQLRGHKIILAQPTKDSFDEH